MVTQISLAFIQEKIRALRHALFLIESDAVLKIPNCIIQALAVDDLGQIWFLVSRPIQEIREFEKEFYAKLDFVRKGTGLYLKILGGIILNPCPSWKQKKGYPI